MYDLIKGKLERNSVYININSININIIEIWIRKKGRINGLSSTNCAG